jgi:hypothetical protein
VLLVDALKSLPGGAQKGGILDLSGELQPIHLWRCLQQTDSSIFASRIVGMTSSFMTTTDL